MFRCWLRKESSAFQRARARQLRSRIADLESQSSSVRATAFDFLREQGRTLLEFDKIRFPGILFPIQPLQVVLAKLKEAPSSERDLSELITIVGMTGAVYSAAKSVGSRFSLRREIADAFNLYSEALLGFAESCFFDLENPLGVLGECKEAWINAPERSLEKSVFLVVRDTHLRRILSRINEGSAEDRFNWIHCVGFIFSEVVVEDRDALIFLGAICHNFDGGRVDQLRRENEEVVRLIVLLGRLAHRYYGPEYVLIRTSISETLEVLVAERRNDRVLRAAQAARNALKSSSN